MCTVSGQSWGGIWKGFGEHKPLESQLAGVWGFFQAEGGWKKQNYIQSRTIMCAKVLECMGCLRSASWSGRRGTGDNKSGAGKTLTAGFGGLNLILLVMGSYRSF